VGVFRMQAAPERVEVRPGTSKYERLEPQRNLRFTVPSPELCVLTLRLEEGVSDPVQLRESAFFFNKWVMRDTAYHLNGKDGRQKAYRGRLFRNQYCIDSRGRFRISRIIPTKGRIISAKALAHLAAHLAMVRVLDLACDGPSPEFLEEAVFYNHHNRRELIVVFNWPLIADIVAAFMGLAMEYIDSCVIGLPDPDFIPHMKRQARLFRERKERRLWRERRQTGAA